MNFTAADTKMNLTTADRTVEVMHKLIDQSWMGSGCCLRTRTGTEKSIGPKVNKIVKEQFGKGFSDQGEERGYLDTKEKVCEHKEKASKEEASYSCITFLPKGLVL